MDPYNKYFYIQLDRLRSAIENGLRPIIDEILGEIKFKSTLKWKDSHSGENRAKLINIAVANNDVDMVKLLLEYGVTIRIDESRTRVKPPLWCAIIQRASEEIVEILIRAGADVNQRAGKYYQFNRGDTPLHAAAIYGNEQLAALLLNNGAKVDAVNRNGETPLHLTVKAKLGGERTARCLLEHGARIDLGCDPVLIFATDQGNVEVARAIIDHRRDAMQCRGYRGKSALHYAVSRAKEDMELLNLLLDKGMQVDQPNNYGETPLHLAVMSENTHMIKTLIDHGADVNAKCYKNMTPLFYAMTKDISIIDLLLRKGADANVAINQETGYTVLHHACGRGFKDIVILLVKHKANLNVTTIRGKTPLIYACTNGYDDIVHILLKAGATIKITKRYKETSYSLTIRNMLTRYAVKNWLHFKSICKYFRQVHKNTPYFLMCLKEMNMMMETEFYDDLTFFKILTVPQDELVRMMKNEKIREAFEAGYTETLFPLYAQDVNERYECVKLTLESLRVRNSAEEILNTIFMNIVPCDVVHKLMTYITYENMQLLDSNKGCVTKLRNIF